MRKARDADTLRDVLGSHLEDLQRMSMIVQDMLFLSQADRGAEARREHVASLAGVARAVVELHEAAIEEAGLKPGVDITIISIDGVRGAFEAMKAGKLNVTVECNPLLGPQLMQLAKDVVAKKPVEKRIKVIEGVFTADQAAKELPNRKY